MTEIINNTKIVCAAVMFLAFTVNIIVQITKGFVPIPTKLWCIIVSGFVTVESLFIGASGGFIKLNFSNFSIAITVSFLISFVAMYGIDTLKDLWSRFKGGENINGN